MRVHVDGHVVELHSPEDVALFVTCLRPTPEQVEQAKQAMYAEREATGLVITEDGRIVGERAA